MLSTTSAEKTSGRSATEVLASRYRHLFVLPSPPLLLAYTAVVNFLLSVASRGVAGVFTFAPAFIVTVLSASAISSALTIADRKTIATFRRVTATVFAGELLWLFCVGCGLLYAWLSGSSNVLSNAFLFGAFACTGFEFLIINGVFTRRRPLAIVLAALFPASTLGIIRLSELIARTDLLVLAFGMIAVVVFAAFTTMLGRNKTSRGFDALQLFQAFMKTWSAGKADDLESAILAHSEEAVVSTKVLRFRAPAGDTFLVLPGVHPGPFHPVGSYDLPGVISKAFEKQGPAMTLHRPGGHERNIATTAETERFAQEISAFAQTITTSENNAKSKGPMDAKIGRAIVSASSFSNDLIMTVSFSPFGSDDLTVSLENEIAKIGEESGFDAYVVDAHNSIDHQQESPDLGESGWRDLVSRLRREDASGFRCAYSHSKESGFPAGGDLTENGVSLFMLEARGTKHVLVLADANNALPSLRAIVAESLESAGYRLIEFCTSDSHNLAARGLTVARGYRPLGEETDVGSIAKLTVEMAKRAEARLSGCAYGSGKVDINMKVIGTKALEEFAAITQASSTLGRNYLRFAVVSIGVLLLFSLIF